MRSVRKNGCAVAAAAESALTASFNVAILRSESTTVALSDAIESSVVACPKDEIARLRIMSVGRIRVMVCKMGRDFGTAEYTTYQRFVNSYRFTGGLVDFALMTH